MNYKIRMQKITFTISQIRDHKMSINNFGRVMLNFDLLVQGRILVIMLVICP